MIPETKQRIAQINSGIIPEGYKKTKVGIVPVEWEEIKLNNISRHITEKNKDMKYNETYTNSATQGIIKQTDYFDKQITNADNIDGYYIVRQNDYVYNPRISVSAPCGPISKSHFSETGIMSPLYTVFRLNDEYGNNDYIEHYFKSSFWYRYMSSVANYGVRHDRMNITNEDLFNMPIPFPPLPEQQKIAEILSTQDKLIELQERKIEQLKTLKKGYLQKMFPKKGAKSPELRFKGFTEPWEKRKLGEVVKSIDTGKSKFHSDSTNGAYAILGSTSIIGYDDCYDYDGDFILTARVGANAGSLYRYTGKAKISDNTVFIQAERNIEFVYYMLTKFDIKQLSFGTGQPLVKASELKNLDLKIPNNIEEQHKIGDFFRNIDNLITLHQHKLDKEKQKKKALMQLLLTGKVRVST